MRCGVVRRGVVESRAGTDAERRVAWFLLGDACLGNACFAWLSENEANKRMKACMQFAWCMHMHMPCAIKLARGSLHVQWSIVHARR